MLVGGVAGAGMPQPGLLSAVPVVAGGAPPPAAASEPALPPPVPADAVAPAALDGAALPPLATFMTSPGSAFAPAAPVGAAVTGAGCVLTGFALPAAPPTAAAATLAPVPPLLAGVLGAVGFAPAVATAPLVEPPPVLSEPQAQTSKTVVSTLASSRRSRLPIAGQNLWTRVISFFDFLSWVERTVMPNRLTAPCALTYWVGSRSPQSPRSGLHLVQRLWDRVLEGTLPRPPLAAAVRQQEATPQRSCHRPSSSRSSSRARMRSVRRVWNSLCRANTDKYSNLLR